MPTNPDFTFSGWPRAHKFPLFEGLIKQTPGDFEVEELLGFEPSGEGEHDFLWVEKVNANTAWVAQMLARHAGVRSLDVGFSGRKDRQAVTRQWFSVRRPSSVGTDWPSFAAGGTTILETTRHNRKLRKGSHRANRFRIRIRQSTATRSQLADAIAAIAEKGVPNYFGAQRFGRGGANLVSAERFFAGQKLPRNKRDIVISAARSLLFNHILASRVSAGTWNQPLPGEAFNLEGSNSLFVEEGLDTVLQDRLRTMDIHPTAALWGCGDAICGEEISKIERTAVAPYSQIRRGLENLGIKKARRATRLVVHELTGSLTKDSLLLTFHLNKGCFATTVLREVVAERPGS